MPDGGVVTDKGTCFGSVFVYQNMSVNVKYHIRYLLYIVTIVKFYTHTRHDTHIVSCYSLR